MNKNQVIKELTGQTLNFTDKVSRLYYSETVSALKDATAFYLGETVSLSLIKELLLPKLDNGKIGDPVLEECITKLPFPSIFLYGSVSIPDEPPMEFAILVRHRDDKWIHETLPNTDSEFMEFMITTISVNFHDDRVVGIRKPMPVAVLPYVSVPIKQHKLGTLGMLRENLFGISETLLGDRVFQLNRVRLSEMIVFYFLKLLSCKNIIVKEGYLGKKNGRKHLPILDYRTLHIQVPGKKYVYENREYESIPFHEKEKFGMTGQKRGHFKTYTEDKPLFGRHVGTWWWSPLFDTSRKRDYVIEKV